MVRDARRRAPHHEEIGRIGCPASMLFAGLSACLLGRCLLKTVICCVPVSNHVPCRRVALLASRSARCGAGADVDWFCRLQRRHAVAFRTRWGLSAQPVRMAARNHGLGGSAPASGRATRASAIFAPANPAAIAVSVLRPAAADRGTAVLSDRRHRRLRRRAGPFVLRAAEPSADGDHRHRRAALDRGNPRIGTGRHHDHRRYQRHAGNAVPPLQCFVRRDPAGQWLQGSARIVAGPATDHSAPDRGGRCSRSGSTRVERPREQDGCRRGCAERSHRQSRRYVAQHRPSQSGAGGGSRQGQRARCLGQSQAWPEGHGAKLEDRGRSAPRTAGRRCRRDAGRRLGARDQTCRRGERSAAERAAGPGHHEG